MAVYSFEGRGTIERLKGRSVVADTSYVRKIVEVGGKYERFHLNALANGTAFYVNVTVRQEFMNGYRRAMLIDAFVHLLSVNPRLRTDVLQKEVVRAANPNDTFEDRVAQSYDRLYKYLIRNEDRLLATALSLCTEDIWAKYETVENAASLIYEPSSLSGAIPSWPALGAMISATGLSVTDSMIANYAVSMNAAAIVTADLDFCQAAGQVDIYLPRTEARKCYNYVAAVD